MDKTRSTVNSIRNNIPCHIYAINSPSKSTSSEIFNTFTYVIKGIANILSSLRISQRRPCVVPIPISAGTVAIKVAAIIGDGNLGDEEGAWNLLDGNFRRISIMIC